MNNEIQRSEDVVKWWKEHGNHDNLVLIEMGGRNYWSNEGKGGVCKGWSEVPDVVRSSINETPVLRLEHVEESEHLSSGTVFSYYRLDEVQFTRDEIMQLSDEKTQSGNNDVAYFSWGMVIYTTEFDMEMMLDSTASWCTVTEDHRGMAEENQ